MCQIVQNQRVPILYISLSMVQRFGSWTALLVSRPIVNYWVWGEPINSIMKSIVPEGYPELTSGLLRSACPIASFFDMIMGWFSWLVVAFMGLIAKMSPVVPSFDISMCLRKRFVYDRVVDAINNGAKQVLVLGGGYDVLILNLAPKYPDVLFIEVDHPKTSVFKRSAIENLGFNYPNIRYLPIDLSVWKLEEKISEECRAWNKDVKSVLVAEGLLMYLTPEAIRQCLRSMKAITPIGSTFVFSYLTQYDFGGSKSLSKINKAMIYIVGEPLHWVPDSADEVSKLISDEGYVVDVSPKQSDNYQQYLAKFGKLNCYNAYVNKNGIAISK